MRRAGGRSLLMGCQCGRGLGFLCVFVVRVGKCELSMWPSASAGCAKLVFAQQKPLHPLCALCCCLGSGSRSCRVRRCTHPLRFL